MSAASQVTYLQQAAVANGNGTPLSTQGFDTAIQVEITETAGGTAAITLQGSFDGTTWYSIGYQQIDATASLARAVAAITVGANSAHVYQVLDPYPNTRAVLASVAGGASVNVRAYVI